MQKLGDAPIGLQIALYRDKFIVLDHLEQGVLVIRAHNWRKSVFDGHTNNLRDACIRTALDEYWQILRSGGAELRISRPDGQSLRPVRKINIDLTAADGTDEYHCVVDAPVGLLTLAQYGKCQRLIPDVDGSWWLATPYRTPAQKGGDDTGVWCVRPKGGTACLHRGNTAAIRPALVLDPQLTYLRGSQTRKEEPERPGLG